jgi:hypothetical protein
MGVVIYAIRSLSPAKETSIGNEEWAHGFQKRLEVLKNREM